MTRARALRPVRTTAPTELPVSLDEAKAHLRVDTTDEDALIVALIQAATDHLDGWSGSLGRCLVDQNWTFTFDRFPACGMLRLPLAPLQATGDFSVQYNDDANSLQTLNTGSYTIHEDDYGPFVALVDGETWPTTYTRPDAVIVAATFGYGTAADVPGPIKAAILLTVGDLYINREAKISNKLVLNPTAAMLIAPFRRAWG